MIEIKCDESQKDDIIYALANSSRCIIGCDVECKNLCRECMEKNIKWTIRGNEDAE